MIVAHLRKIVCGRGWLALCAVWLLVGCEKSPFDRTQRGMDEGEQKQAARDYPGAISGFEQALDGTSKTSEAHFRMGLIYAQKLNDQVSAVYQFRRYLELSPNGSHVAEAKANLARLEMTLATNLAGGTLVSHKEAMRLKTENADLKKQLAARNNPPPPTNAASTMAANLSGSLASRNGTPQKPPPGSRAYQVQPGDTLASISRKFYKTKVRAKDIQDANLNSVPDVTKLKTGQTLIIPE